MKIKDAIRILEDTKLMSPIGQAAFVVVDALKKQMNGELIEVVRCKDCTYHLPTNRCEMHRGQWSDNNYCGYAEQK